MYTVDDLEFDDYTEGLILHTTEVCSQVQKATNKYWAINDKMRQLNIRIKRCRNRVQQVKLRLQRDSYSYLLTMYGDYIIEREERLELIVEELERCQRIQLSMCEEE